MTDLDAATESVEVPGKNTIELAVDQPSPILVAFGFVPFSCIQRTNLAIEIIQKSGLAVTRFGREGSAESFHKPIFPFTVYLH
jgi:hypothetical protein